MGRLEERLCHRRSITVASGWAMVSRDRVWIRVPVLARMVESGLRLDDVVSALEHGLVIEQCAENCPYPRQLILAFISGRPLHLIVFTDTSGDRRFLAAVYEPKPELWQALFTRRIHP
jgi:hypothetical protein